MIAAQTGGPADAPPLLLLAGQANSHRWWDGLREAFEADFATVTFDYRGTGETGDATDAPMSTWSTRLFAQDAVDVMTRLGHERFAVYGTSMGGRVAQMLAADHPERVTRLVLACTSPGGPHAVERSQEVRRRLADPDRRARGRSLVDLFYTPAWRGRPSDRTLFGDPRMSPEASAAHLRVSAAHDAWQVLPTIAAPTLVLHGSDDLMVPTANAPLLAQRIPGALLHLHHGGRHGFFDEFADEIGPLALDFLLG